MQQGAGAEHLLSLLKLAGAGAAGAEALVYALTAVMGRSRDQTCLPREGLQQHQHALEFRRAAAHKLCQLIAAHPAVPAACLADALASAERCTWTQGSGSLFAWELLQLPCVLQLQETLVARFVQAQLTRHGLSEDQLKPVLGLQLLSTSTVERLLSTLLLGRVVTWSAVLDPTAIDSHNQDWQHSVLQEGSLSTGLLTTAAARIDRVLSTLQPDQYSFLSIAAGLEQLQLLQALCELPAGQALAAAAVQRLMAQPMMRLTCLLHYEAGVRAGQMRLEFRLDAAAVRDQLSRWLQPLRLLLALPAAAEAVNSSSADLQDLLGAMLHAQDTLAQQAPRNVSKVQVFAALRRLQQLLLPAMDHLLMQPAARQQLR